MKNFFYVTVKVGAIKLTWRVLLFNYIESNLSWRCLPTLLSFAAPFHFGWLNVSVVKSVENNFLGFWNFDSWSSWSHPDKRRISFHHGQRYGCWGSTRALGYIHTKEEGKKLRPKLFDRWMILWIRLYSIDNVVGHYNIPLGCPLNTVFTVLSYCFICCLLLRNSKINVKCSPYYKKPTKNVRFVVLSYVKTRRYIFNNYSSSTNWLWVNSPLGLRPHKLLTQRAMRERGMIVLVKSN